MRIQSSFTEDNLYSRHSRRPKGKSPYRLLMRLVLAMILVIAVMRQAGNPRVYEAFFPASGDDVVAKVQVITRLPASPPGEGRHPYVGPAEPLSVEAKKMQRAVANQLDQTLVSMGDEKNAELMTRLGQWRTAGRVGTTVLSDEWSDRLEQAFIQSGQKPVESLDWNAESVITLLQSALDRWAIGRVDAAAVWKGADTLGFYRLLEDDPARPTDDAASRTSVTSLLQQPDVYLRRRVILPASVARAIRRPAAENPFGVQVYWEVWLRPRDGSERPFVMFTREVSSAIAAIGGDSALTDGPPVWVDGVFLKRIAYQSSLGRELAPAVVGTLYEPAASSDLPATVLPPSPTNGWLVVAGSALIGVSVAALIFFQSGKAIARSRALRRKTRPAAPSFFASFDQADRREVDPGETLS
ncbi:MAG TPA: hypothetical protein DDZ51_28475 [Planctomycetaceae bacterium]|nr:hypothetical protein [Planctomycetaceae bacterium]